MRHLNIPIFIPHLGCPNQCVFCNQRTISGVDRFSLDKVRSIIDEALSTVEENAEAEIAFFGGSFTGIDRELMISLLEIAYGYVKSGRVRSLRCSTRPDYIDQDILDILKKYGMQTIELGLQSSSEDVLKMSKRGHNFTAEINACKLILQNGFDLVGQMMIGLPGADIDSEIKTAEFICSVGASAARIYPTVVFCNTELAEMALNGEYTPLSIESAVERSARVLDVFIKNGVKVIRIGLQASDGLSSDTSYVAGPNHPSLGEMVIGELYYNRICDLLQKENPSYNKKITILSSRSSLSKAIGHKRRNKDRLKEKYPNISFAESDDLAEYEVKLKITDGEMKCI